MKENKDQILDRITHEIYKQPHSFILNLFSTKNKQFKYKNDKHYEGKQLSNNLSFTFNLEGKMIEVDVKQLMERISKDFRNFKFSSIKNERKYSPYQIYKFYKKIVEMDEKSRTQIKSKFFENLEDGYDIHFYYDFTLINMDDKMDEIHEDIIENDLQKISSKEKNDDKNITTINLNAIIEYKNDLNNERSSIKVRKLKIRDISENKSKDERFDLSLYNLDISVLEKILCFPIDQMNQHDYKLKDTIRSGNKESKFSSLFPEYKNELDNRELYNIDDIESNKNIDKTMIDDETSNKKQDITYCEKTDNIKTDTCSKCKDYDISLVKFDQPVEEEKYYKLDFEEIDNIRMFIIGNIYNERTTIIKDILNEVSDKYPTIALFTSSFDEYIPCCNKMNNIFLYYDDPKDELSEEKKTERFFKRVRCVMDKIDNYKKIHNKSNNKTLIIFDELIILDDILASKNYKDDIILIRKILGGEYENIDFIFSNQSSNNSLDILLSRDNSATGIFLDKFSKLELEFGIGKKIYPDDNYYKYRYNNKEAIIIRNINGYGLVSAFASKNEIFIKRKPNL